MTIQKKLIAQKQMYGEIIKDVDFSKQSLPSLRFEECLFEHVNFTNANLINCFFIDCTFRHCNLSLVEVKNCHFNTVEFIECKLVGINWYEINENSLLGNTFIFDKCILTSSSFSGLTICSSTFVECKLAEVDFSDANCSYCDFSHSDCSLAKFNHTNLTECNFSYATNYNINIYSNTLKSALFSSTDAINLLISSGILIEP